MTFRKDINGLRAIAVIAVVLFHFNPSWVQGGFAGVDVFFVISGFLMTGIIFKGLENNSFSILNFYIARANRIVPALTFVCAVLLILGWFYIPPTDYELLGKHVASSLGFISNVVYWREAGYFDAASHEKWLLHTWSLSVEWQFYIIYPLILVLLSKLMPLRLMKVLLAIGTVLAFIFAVIATYRWSNSAYYLLPTRMWEMMVGCIAFIYPLKLSQLQKRLLEWLGLALILSSYFFVSELNHWPGYLAALPVVGAFFIIQAQRNDSFLTSNFIFQKIGAWSYSIYLWHWPIVVFLYYLTLEGWFIYGGIVLSILLGFLSHKYIEKIKFKRDFSTLLSYVKCKPVYMALVIGSMGAVVFNNHGFQSHYPLKVLQINNELISKNPHGCLADQVTRNPFTPCFVGNKDNIKAIVVGDSHADALIGAITASMDLNKEGLLALTKGGCIFILGAHQRGEGDGCLKENIKRMELLNQNYNDVPVFLASRTSWYVYPKLGSNLKQYQGPRIYFTKPHSQPSAEFYDEFKVYVNKTVKELMLNHPVYLIQPTPEIGKHIPKELSKNILFNIEGSDLSFDLDKYHQRNDNLRRLFNEVAQENNITVLDPIPYLCDHSRCIAELDGLPIYYDDHHISEYGNKLIAPLFEFLD